MRGIQFTERALAWLDDSSRSQPGDGRGTWNALGHSEPRTDVERFSYRLARLKRKAVKSSPAAALGLRITGS